MFSQLTVTRLKEYDVTWLYGPLQPGSCQLANSKRDLRFPAIKYWLLCQYGEEAYSEEEKHVGNYASKIIINRLPSAARNSCSTS
jgi:hypothetical protein